MKIELVITWICNWFCEYCAVDTHNQPAFDLDEKLTKIPTGAEVTLSGGEPGALKKDKLIEIINYLKDKNCVLNINTNGTFIKRYPDLLDNFKTINYHCTENIDTEDEVLIGEYKYLVIVTDNNFYKLGNFLQKNPNIKFNLIGASNPRGRTAPDLSRNNELEMLKLYSHRMTKESIIRAIEGWDEDAIIYI